MAQLTEHSSKMLLARFGVPVSTSILTSTPDEAARAAAEIGYPVAVKAQIAVGGRGKLAAILRSNSVGDIGVAFSRVISIEIEGMRATTALIEPWVQMERELYLSVLVDPELQGPAVLFSQSGGVDIESGQTPVIRVPLRRDYTLSAAAFRHGLANEGLSSKLVERVAVIANRLAHAFYTLDATLAEVNPLAELSDGRLLAIDARVVADDHALFRQNEVAALITSMATRRIEDLVRDRTGLEYVQMGGNIGLISGGAGMTMAAMDLIAGMGASPACFLDCSANPTRDGYRAALDLLLDDPNVKVILISVFGGLTQVDRVARTLASLLHEKPATKPLTFRLMGTNVDEADRILAEAHLINHRSLEDAVGAAVRSAGSDVTSS